MGKPQKDTWKCFSCSSFSLQPSKKIFLKLATQKPSPISSQNLSFFPLRLQFALPRKPPPLFLSSPASHHLLHCAPFRRHVILSNYHHGQPCSLLSPCSWSFSRKGPPYLKNEKVQLSRVVMKCFLFQLTKIEIIE